MISLYVFGSAAGGGFPQWNCHCPNCHGFRRGTLKTRARSQSSIGISENREDWVLVNASPDLPFQMETFFKSFPLPEGKERRYTPLKSIILTDAQIDHCAGLLSLREHSPWTLFSTPGVFQELAQTFPLLNVLGHYGQWKHQSIPLDGSDFRPPGTKRLFLTALPVPGLAPPYSPKRPLPPTVEGGFEMILKVEDPSTGKNLVYAPSLNDISSEAWRWMEESDLLLVDGTCWSDGELVDLGLSQKTARSMGHRPLSGEDGLLKLLRNFEKPRKVLIHINNTNPILDEDSYERKMVEEQGLEVAFDGMEIIL